MKLAKKFIRIILIPIALYEELTITVNTIEYAIVKMIYISYLNLVLFFKKNYHIYI